MWETERENIHHQVTQQIMDQLLTIQRKLKCNQIDVNTQKDEERETKIEEREKKNKILRLSGQFSSINYIRSGFLSTRVVLICFFL